MNTTSTGRFADDECPSQTAIGVHRCKMAFWGLIYGASVNACASTLGAVLISAAIVLFQFQLIEFQLNSIVWTGFPDNIRESLLLGGMSAVLGALLGTMLGLCLSVVRMPGKRFLRYGVASLCFGIAACMAMVASVNLTFGVVTAELSDLTSSISYLGVLVLVGWILPGAIASWAMYRLLVRRMEE